MPDSPNASDTVSIDQQSKPSIADAKPASAQNADDHDFKRESYRPSVDFGPLKRVNWADTPLGEMKSWPACLKALASLLVTLPYAAAIFWGDEFVMIHNSPWSAIPGSVAGQGRPARDLMGDEAIGRLKATMMGQVHDTHSKNFFSKDDQEVPHLRTVLHPLCGEGDGIEGVMAQFIPPAVSTFGTLGRKKDQKPKSKAEGENGAKQPDKPEHAHTQFSRKKLVEWLQGATHEETLSKDQGNSEQDTGRLFQDLPIDGRVLFQKFAHMIPTGLAILDSNAEALFVNDLFYKLTTHSGASPFRAWPQSIHPDDYDRVMKDYKNAFHTDEVLSTQFRAATADANATTTSWRLFMMRPISDEAPIAQDGYICAIIDITSLKAAELYQRRIASEAIERKHQQEKFMDMISHEIRNPLSAILHCSEGILESIRGSPEGDDVIDVRGAHSKNHIVDQECLNEIVEAAETILFCVAHQKNIVDDILSFSKLDAMMLSLNPSPFQPDQKFAQYLRIFQPELRDKNITIKFAIDPSYPEAGVEWVHADMVRINQVLVNLMTNAIKFTARKNGERNITVSLGASLKRPTSYPPSVVFFNDEEAAHRMDATRGPEWGSGKIMYLLVAVRDTGIGISDKDQARLFERFHQATPKTQEQYGGSGLGLFISRKLCQLHGGDIGVSSKEGAGSTFGFFFKIRQITKPTQGEIKKRDSDSHDSSLVPNDLPIDDKTPESLINPPVESRKEAHPGASSDERFEHSVKIAAEVEKKVEDQAKLSGPEEKAQEEKEQEAQAGEKRAERELESRGSLPVSRSESRQRDRSRERKHTVGSNQDKEVSHDQPESQVDDRPGLSSEESHRGGMASENQEPPKTSSQESESRDGPKLQDVTIRTIAPKHILLVEDNIINQRVLKRHLKAKGFRVSTANNGQEAVDMHLSRLEGQERINDEAEREGRTSDTGIFECILMDQEMPVMDGNTATRTIRQNENNRGTFPTYRVPVLGISANARDAQREGMFQAGMDDVIRKPFSMADLVTKIYNAIDTVQKH